MRVAGTVEASATASSSFAQLVFQTTANLQPSASTTLLIVLKRGLPLSERDLYRLARVTPTCWATSLMPLALAAMFRACMKSAVSPMLATSRKKPRISSSVSRCSAISKGKVSVVRFAYSNSLNRRFTFSMSVVWLDLLPPTNKPFVELLCTL